MPYRISGISRVTREPIKPFISDASSEVAARADAIARGIVIRSVQALPGKSLRPNSPTRLATAAAFGDESPEYEFSLQDQSVMNSLAMYMNIVGLFLMAMGTLLAVGMLYLKLLAPVHVVNATMALLIGALIRVAAKRFRHISGSPGEDVTQLMSALAGLRTVYAVQAWSVILLVGTMVLILGAINLQRFLP